MPDPTVSVLMPVYNAEAYLAEAIDSVLNQSFADFEFLALDDGSTDESWTILESFAADDDRTI
jgi:glycosyltransferase involved in cell wall biosynthesis